MSNIRPLELFLVQFIFYTIMWLWNDYLATLMTLIFPPICFVILIVSLIADQLERSNVPKWYYSTMIISILVPIIAAIVFVGFVGFDFDWMHFRMPE